MVDLRSLFTRNDPPFAALSEPAVRTAQRVVDNRLRAMRFWLEYGGVFSAQYVTYLRENLEQWLDEFRSMQGGNDPHLYAMAEIVHSIEKPDYPRFERLYEAIGIQVPKTVGAPLWYGNYDSEPVVLKVPRSPYALKDSHKKRSLTGARKRKTVPIN